MSTLNSTERFRGRVIRVTVDDVVLPNGRQTALEVVHHPGGAAIVALNDLQQVCLLRQYRYVAGGWIWELPAGKLEPGEPPETTARRELTEEAGVTATDWVGLGSLLSSPRRVSRKSSICTSRRGCPPAARSWRTARCWRFIG